MSDTPGEVRAFDLSIPEGMLLEHADSELENHRAVYQTRVAAILRAHGLDPSDADHGHFQRDPLVPSQWRFLYRSAAASAAPVPLALPPSAGGDG